MSEAVENLVISSLPQDTTRVNSSRRRVMPSSAAVREASRPTSTAASTITRDSPSIFAPVVSR